jgi:DNA-binding transcriptional LysR family regulator
MLDAVSLDQLRTFIAAVDEGSFSAASRKLLRAQSVVSDTIANLEDQIGVQLFDRSGRYPKLTPEGSVLLRDARSIITNVDLLKARAKGMSAGLEPELSVVIDVFYPIDAVTQVATEFRQKYPGVALRIYVEALGGAIKPVLEGQCSIGVVGSLPVIPDTLTFERLPGITFLMVAARDHALTSYQGKIPRMSSESTRRSSSPTARNCLPGASSASCRRRRGGWPTCSPSITSCSRDWAGAGCPCTSYARTSRRAASRCCRSRTSLRTA